MENKILSDIEHISNARDIVAKLASNFDILDYSFLKGLFNEYEIKTFIEHIERKIVEHIDKDKLEKMINLKVPLKTFHLMTVDHTTDVFCTLIVVNAKNRDDAYRRLVNSFDAMTIMLINCYKLVSSRLSENELNLYHSNTDHSELVVNMRKVMHKYYKKHIDEFVEIISNVNYKDPSQLRDDPGSIILVDEPMLKLLEMDVELYYSKPQLILE